MKTSKSSKSADPIDVTRRFDSWTNLFTGLGLLSRDKRQSTSFGSPVTLSKSELSDLYTGNRLAQRICDLPAQSEFREWFEVVVDHDAQTVNEAVQTKLEELDAMPRCIEARSMARLYGGSVLVLGIDDGQDPLEPLNENGIKAFEWLTVLDRHDVVPMRWYSNISDKKYGEPEIYQINPTSVIGTPGVIEHPMVHESRLIRFDGVQSTRLQRSRTLGWHESVFTAMYDDLRADGEVWAAAQTLVTDFSQAVIRLKGLAESIAADGVSTIQTRLQAMDMARSVMRALVLDENESFERVATPMGGLDTMLDKFETRVAAVAGMPVTLLFGRSPAGLNATGDSDIRNWYDGVAADRALHTTHLVRRLVHLVMLAGGKEPANWKLQWKPLWQQTMTEKLVDRQAQATIDNTYITAQVLDPDEVTQSRFGGTEYGFETTVDLEARRAMKLEEKKEEEAAKNPPPPPPAGGPAPEQLTGEEAEAYMRSRLGREK